MPNRSLNQVQIKNYKSIAGAVVGLSSFTALVGPNGAGKSNFVDSLRFVSECVTNSVALALQNRGGINAVRRRSTGHPTNFGFRLTMNLEEGQQAEYSFEIAAQRQGRFSVKRERCLIKPSFLGPQVVYEVENGVFVKEVEGVRTKLEPDRLALTILSALEEFRPVYDFLTSMRFYAIAPDRVRQLQEPDPGDWLRQDGGNAAAVLREVQRRQKEPYARLCRYLQQIVPGTRSAEYRAAGPMETITFRQDVGGDSPWAFDALSMSDGTLRILGILLAVYQVSPASLLIIEEPEATIHPAALEVLLDVLREASSVAQLVVTTHSPDLLDNKHITDAELRSVSSARGRTEVGPVSAASRDVVRQHLSTPGDLLRMGELGIDSEMAEENARQLALFGSPLKGSTD